MRWAGLLFAGLLLGGFARADDPDGKALMRSRDPAQREKAAVLLGKQGKTDAAKLLLKLVADRDWGVSLKAIRALGPIRYGPAREELEHLAVEGEIRAIRLAAAEALRDHAAKEAARTLGKRAMKLRDKEKRRRAIQALGVIGTAEAVKALEKNLKAPDPLFREEAAVALGLLGAGEKPLTTAMQKDREFAVKMRAAESLARIDSDPARAAILDFVGRRTEEDDAYILRRVARGGKRANQSAFGKALDEAIRSAKKPYSYLVVAARGPFPGAAQGARKHLKHRDTLTRAFAYRVASLAGDSLSWDEVRRALDHKDRRLRYAAALAYLESARTSDARKKALEAVILHKKGDVAIVGVRFAAEQKAREALPALEALACGRTGAKKDWQARTAACVALGRVGYRDAAPALLELAGEKKWWLRAAALEGLYHTYDKRAVPLYIQAYAHRHPVVRMTARRNLRYMTGKNYPNKDQYLTWWSRVKGQIEFKPPEERERQAKKYGYATPDYRDILRGTDIIAIKGRWDKVEKILEDLKVKHFAVRQQQIKDSGLAPKQIVLVNCEGSVDSRVTEFLQWFVVAGGYMATTDWALVNATRKTFPGVVGGYVKQSTGNDVVVVEPAAPEHPTLAGVFRPNVELKWWLEIQAFPIAVVDPIRATVLVDSLQMLDRYGSSAMMVEFPAGLGKVLHSTSHFFLQKEGFAHAPDARRRMIFAADHLGLAMEEIRSLDAEGVFANVNDTTPISRSYSMFHLLVNFIEEKRAIDKTK